MLFYLGVHLLLLQYENAMLLLYFWEKTYFICTPPCIFAMAVYTIHWFYRIPKRGDFLGGNIQWRVFLTEREETC